MIWSEESPSQTSSDSPPTDTQPLSINLCKLFPILALRSFDSRIVALSSSYLQIIDRLFYVIDKINLALSWALLRTSTFFGTEQALAIVASALLTGIRWISVTSNVPVKTIVVGLPLPTILTLFQLAASAMDSSGLYNESNLEE
jgi:hypothetical protein